jgi:hypothetical protein
LDTDNCIQPYGLRLEMVQVHQTQPKRRSAVKAWRKWLSTLLVAMVVFASFIPVFSPSKADGGAWGGYDPYRNPLQDVDINEIFYPSNEVLFPKKLDGWARGNGVSWEEGEAFVYTRSGKSAFVVAEFKNPPTIALFAVAGKFAIEQFPKAVSGISSLAGSIAILAWMPFGLQGSNNPALETGLLEWAAEVEQTLQKGPSHIGEGLRADNRLEMLKRLAEELTRRETDIPDECLCREAGIGPDGKGHSPATLLKFLFSFKSGKRSGGIEWLNNDEQDGSFNERCLTALKNMWREMRDQEIPVPDWAK